MQNDRPIVLQVLALAKNCEPFTRNFSTFLYQIKRRNIDVQVLVGENGSSDGTRTALMAHLESEAIGFQLMDTSFMAEINNRLLRMAHGRESLIKAYRRLFKPADYVLVCDIDNVFADVPCSENFIKEVYKLGADKQCYAVSASSNPYYDLIALDSPDISSNFQEMITGFKRNALTYRKNMKRHVYKFQEKFEPGSVRIISAFNGMCLYRNEDYLRSSYLQDGNTNQCEHVTFNRRLHNETGFYMRISEEFAVQAPSEHIRCSEYQFFMRYIAKKMNLIRGNRWWLS